MVSSDTLLLDLMCSSFPCKLMSAQLKGLSKRRQSAVARWTQNPLLLHAGALDEAAGQQLTQQGIPAFAMFDANDTSTGLPTGVLGCFASIPRGCNQQA